MVTRNAVALANNVSVVREVAKTGRSLRKPSHTFHLRYRPYQIQPCYIAPVWPGETMQNLLLQARVMTDPIANPLVGWWTEYYFFYVKLRDLAPRDELQEMIVRNASTASLVGAADVKETYHSGGGINYTKLALDVVTKWYFRDEDDAVMVAALDGLPLAKTDAPGWFQSAKDATVVGESDDVWPGESPVLPEEMEEFADHFAQYQAMRSMGYTQNTFEDWLASFGVRVPQAENHEEHKPELVRYVRKWEYPTATVDPSDGSAANGVSWSVAERADKDRFFKEPGFLFGVTVTRPKVYFQKQHGSLSHYMNDAFAWLPSSLASEAYTRLKKFVDADGDGPLGSLQNHDYWVDMADLALHGDQFMNFDQYTETGFSGVPLPGPNLNKKWVDGAAVDALFKGEDSGRRVQADGRIDTTILTRLMDATP